MARPEADPRRGQRRHRRSHVQGGREDHPAQGQPGRQGRPQEPHHPDRGNLRPLLGVRPDQREDRRDLHRGRRRSLAPRISKSSTRPASTRSSCSTSITSTPARGSATRSRPTRPRTRDQALSDIYRVMRPGEPPTRETADALFYGLFFDSERYDLSRRRPRQAQHAPRPRRRGHGHHAAPRGHPRGGQGAGRT